MKLDDLIKTSQKTGQLSVKKQLQNVKKLKSLSIPLSKPQLEKVCNMIFMSVYYIIAFPDPKLFDIFFD